MRLADTYKLIMTCHLKPRKTTFSEQQNVSFTKTQLEMFQIWRPYFPTIKDQTYCLKGEITNIIRIISGVTCWFAKHQASASFSLPITKECQSWYMCACVRVRGHVRVYIYIYIYIYIFTVIYYNDVIMGAIASEITSLAIVFATVYSDVDQENIKIPRHWPLCGEFSRTNGQ